MQHQARAHPPDRRRHYPLPGHHPLSHLHQLSRLPQKEPASQFGGVVKEEVDQPSDNSDTPGQQEVKSLLAEAKAFSNSQRPLPMSPE
jgi:hypothetical protein